MDNFPDRYLINEECWREHIPFVHGAVEGFIGQLTTNLPERGPCLKCIISAEPPEKPTFPVLGSTPGVIGCLGRWKQSKLKTGVGKPLVGRMLFFNGEDITFARFTSNGIRIARFAEARRRYKKLFLIKVGEGKMARQKLTEKISEMKEEKNAILLAHNYQVPEIQIEADYIGDSLGLARKSSEVDAETVVFAGVDFMAETAAMLNPDKKILIPDRKARCPMAAMLPVEEVKKAKRERPDAAVVLYVNTLVEARAEADITCTSANSARVVNAIDEDVILFGPDRNLAWHVKQNTDKEVIPIPERGYCYVHRMFEPADIELLREDMPGAEVLVHPECNPEVQKLADHICSTSQMLRRSRESSAEKFIIATEEGLVHRLKRELPAKKFTPALMDGICQQMKLHTLEKVYRALRDGGPVVEVPSEIADRARAATERMLEI